MYIIYLYLYRGTLFHIKNEITSFTATLMGLEIVKLSEKTQQRKTNTYDIAYMWNPKK